MPSRSVPVGGASGLIDAHAANTLLVHTQKKKKKHTMSRGDSHSHKPKEEILVGVFFFFLFYNFVFCWLSNVIIPPFSVGKFSTPNQVLSEHTLDF